MAVFTAADGPPRRKRAGGGPGGQRWSAEHRERGRPTADRSNYRCDRVLANGCGERSGWSNTEALEHTMRKIPMTIAAARIVVAAIAAPTKAEARWWGGWRGAGIAAGVIGGAVIASRAYGYGGY